MKNALSLILLVSSMLLKAQTYKIIDGEFEAPFIEKSREYIQMDKDTFYVLRINSQDLSLTAFKKINLERIFEKNFILKKDEEFWGINKQNGEILLQTITEDKTENKSKLFVWQINGSSGLEQGKPWVMHEYTKEKNIDIGVYEPTFSPDQTKMLIVERKKTKDETKVTAKLYDLVTHTLIWEKEPADTYESYKLKSYSYLTDNESRFLYFSEYKKNGEDNYSVAAVVQRNTLTSEFLDFSNNNKKLFRIKPQSIDGNIIITGQFQDKDITNYKENFIEKTGVFLMTIDPENVRLKDISFNYLSKEICDKLDYKSEEIKDRAKAYKKTRFTDYKKNFIHYQTIYKNNCFYTIFYNSANFTQNLYFNMGRQEATYGEVKYNYGREILIFKYDENNKLEWSRIIPRLTNGTTYWYYDGERKDNWKHKSDAFNIVFSDKNLYVLYYDNKRNITAFPDVTKYDFKKYKELFFKLGVPLCVTLDEKGNMKREIIFSEEKIQLHRAAIPLEISNTAIIYKRTKKRKNMVNLISFDAKL